MDKTGHYLKDVLKGKRGWARGWVMRPVQRSRQETEGAKDRVQDGQRECLDSEQEEGKLQRERGVLPSSRGPVSPGLPGNEIEKPGEASGPWDTAKRCWLAVHSTDIPWGVTSLNLTVLPGTWVRAVPLAAVLMCLPRSTYPGPNSCAPSLCYG